MTASLFFNRMIFNASSGGTADFVVASPVPGYRVPAGIVPNGAIVSYTAETADKSQWEVGQGACNTGTVLRTTVRENSLGTTAKINFTTAPIVRLDYHTQDVLEFLQGIVTSQFDKTNDVTLADVPGLSLSLRAGAKYRGRATLYTTMSGANGMKVGMGGTVIPAAPAGSFRAHAFPLIGGASPSNGQVVTALGQITSGASSFTIIELSFYIDVLTAGTLTVTFSQGISGGTASSVQLGSNITATSVP